MNLGSSIILVYQGASAGHSMNVTLEKRLPGRKGTEDVVWVFTHATYYCSAFDGRIISETHSSLNGEVIGNA
jgi:hypothetical protein